MNIRYLLLLPLLAFSANMTLAALPPKPNVILIYTDDHGYADLGVQGSVADVKTPHLDALARDGVRFTNGYVTAPQCVPSRAGVITGRYQQRFGVEDNLRGPLPLEELTIAERLKQAGYVAGQIGKWHLGHLDAADRTEKGKRDSRAMSEFLPHAHGFDEYWCGPKTRYTASHDLAGNRFPDAPREVTDGRFRIDVQTEAALSFLDRRAKQPNEPFFLYLAWFAPHVPLEAPDKYLARFPDVKDPTRRTGLAMISAMDDGVGLIRAKLRAMKAEQNTLIFFISDNGAPLKEGAWDGSLNLPFIGEKGMLTDGGLRVPFVAAWPGVLPAGKVYDAPVISLDVAATAVALAGLPHDPALDGVNLVPFLTGAKAGNPHDLLFWRWRSQAAVREQQWKFVRLAPGRRYLFDLASAEGENKNRIAEFPQIAAGLEQKLTSWTATLKPPGMPNESNAADRAFFDTHVDKTAGPVTKPGKNRAESGETIQGWVGRNCRLSIRDGALQVEPTARGETSFIAQAGLQLTGPVAVRLQLRSAQAGQGSIRWRLADQKDFPAGQVVPFDIAPGGEWQEVRATLPATGDVIHTRVVWPKGQPVELRSIQFSSAGKGERKWSFNAAK